MPSSSMPVEIFCCYAHEDKAYRKQLETHLSLLEREGLISLWHDQQILPGANWAKTIDTYLETAQIILLLISANFIASDYCYSVEMKRALERHNANEARVVPILVRPCDWEELPVASLQALPEEAKPISSWTNKDEVWSLITKELRHVIEDIPQLSARASQTAFPPIWMIPYARNPFFLGRDDLLSQISTQLKAGQTMALSQPQALSGLGGIGKTQIAVEYAYSHSQAYQIVLWARAESIEALNTSYSQIAVKLNLPEKDEKKQEIVVEAVKTWLQRHQQWLLILDNADELNIIKSFLPPVIGGHLLITTRAGTTGRLAKRLEVETFTEEQGILFLLRRASLLATDAPLSQATEHDQVVAQKIVHELGGLPLALDQAGAYIDETECGLDDYLKLYQTHQNHLLKRRGAFSEDYPQSVASTWSLAFERVEQTNPAAADLLRFCAFLSPDAIPEEVITKGSTYLGPLLAPFAENPLLLNEAILALRAYSLINRDAQAHTLSVHRLVQTVLCDSMIIEKRCEWKQRTVLALHNVCPNVQDPKQWNVCEQWIPHALICSLWIEQEQISTEEAAFLLYKAGFYLNDHARYSEAEPLLFYALHIREKNLGPDHPQVAYPLYELAILYKNQGRYSEAEPLHLRALHIREQSFGLLYPDVAYSLNGLANLYSDQGKYTEAEPLYLRALHIWEQNFGSYHLRVAHPLNGLANLYSDQGKYAEAEPLYLRALHIREQSLGLDHPQVATPLNGLAILYSYQGKYVQAEALFLRALHIWEHSLNPLHPKVAYYLHNLAIIYYEQDKYAQAEALFLRALHIREQSLGLDHPQVAYPLNGLAELYFKQGKYSEVEPLYQRALHIWEHSLGPGHPLVAHPLNNLATLYYRQGKYAEAEPLFLRALRIREHNFGSEHPDMVESLNGLATLYKDQGKYVEAESFYQRALHIREQSLGPHYPLTQKVRKNYALLLRAMKRDEEAAKLEEEA